MCLWLSSFIFFVKAHICGECNYQVLFCMQLSGLWFMWLPSFPRKQGSWGQHGAHLGPTGPRWAHVGPINFAIWVTLYVAFKCVVYVTVKFCVVCSYRMRRLCDCQFVCSYRVYVITNYGVICSYRSLVYVTVAFWCCIWLSSLCLYVMIGKSFVDFAVVVYQCDCQILRCI